MKIKESSNTIDEEISLVRNRAKLQFNIRKSRRRHKEQFYSPISELIFQKVATEIKHILRLSRLKEYASPENKISIGFIVHRKKLKRSKNSIEGFSLELVMTKRKFSLVMTVTCGYITLSMC